MLYGFRVVNIFLNGTHVRSRVNLIHFKGVQLEPYETYMMKLTCCTWDCLLEHGAHSRHITQNRDISYFEKWLTYRCPMKYFWNILLNIFFFCSTHGFDIESYDILYSILCKLYILRIGVLDWHIHCARVWYEIIKIVEHSLDFHLGSCKHFDEVENVSGIFIDWYRILLWNFEICTISLFSFGWWYTLMNNTHQISSYIGPKKGPTFCR